MGQKLIVFTVLSSLILLCWPIKDTKGGELNPCKDQIQEFSRLTTNSVYMRSYLESAISKEDFVNFSKIEKKVGRILTEEEREKFRYVNQQFVQYLMTEYVGNFILEAISLLLPNCEEVANILNFYKSEQGQRILAQTGNSTSDQLQPDYIDHYLEDADFERIMRDFLERKIGAFSVPSKGMLPTLEVGDNFFLDKLIYQSRKPQRLDVIVFKYPKDETKIFVKRIIGVPGDKISIKDKYVYLNDETIEEWKYTQRVDPGIINESVIPRDNLSPVVVPEDSYFVMGDNRDQSLDSRFWGFVKKKKIIGKAQYIYFSFNRRTKEINLDRFWKKIN